MTNRFLAWAYLASAAAILGMAASPWVPAWAALVGMCVGSFFMGLSAGARLERWVRARAAGRVR